MSTRSTGTRTALRRDDLVERALAVADEQGLDAVTIRRLAEEFAVTPMAMYWHFAAKDDLLAAMGDRVLEEIELPDRTSGLGPFLTAALSAVVDTLRRHASAAALVPARMLSSARGCDLTESTLDVLADAGFDTETAAAIAHNALQTAVMLVAGEPGRQQGMPSEAREEVVRAKRTALEALPPYRYPRLIAAADAMTSCDDPDTYYSSSIDMFVAGVVAQAT